MNASIIINEKSLTSLGYSVMKTAAIADIKLTIAATTEKSKDEIGQAITITKSEALKYINKEYELILKELGEYIRTKYDFDNKTNLAIEAMKKATSDGVNIKQSMNEVLEQGRKMNQDVVITRASITKANKIKREIGQSSSRHCYQSIKSEKRYDSH